MNNVNSKMHYKKKHEMSYFGTQISLLLFSLPNYLIFFFNLKEKEIEKNQTFFLNQIAIKDKRSIYECTDEQFGHVYWIKSSDLVTKIKIFSCIETDHIVTKTELLESVILKKSLKLQQTKF